jgi:hypothetical protein
MDKEEKKKLKAEYEQFSKKNKQKTFFINLLYLSILCSIIIFWLPTNILSEYPWLEYFTDFMGGLFPNIYIYAQRSSVPELTVFYFSYMWMVTIIIIILAIALIPKENKEVKKYFGVDEYRGKGILPYKYIIFYYDFTAILSTIGLILLFGMITYENYIGELINGGISRLGFEEAISRRFGMFFISNIFQSISVFVSLVNLIYICLYMTAIIKIKKGE